MQKQNTLYTHPRKAKCLCGSGLKFKRCCFDNYQKERGASAFIELFNAKKYDEALIQCRADITRYTIWHKSHTEPPFKAGYKPIIKLLELDIKALSEMVDILLRCYERQNILQEFPAVLDRLRENIKDERWRHRIVYFQALCALLPNWNEKAGKRELKKLGSIHEVNDVEILQLFLELEADELNFTEKLKLIDKIINLSEKWVDVLQYNSLRAIQYILVGDMEEAKAILTHAVEEARKNIDDSITAYEALRAGEAIVTLTPLINDENLAQEAVSLFKKALKFDNLNPKGEADIYQKIGNVWMNINEWEKAKENYAKSLESSPHNVSMVFLAQCHIQTEQLTEAKAILSEVVLEKLTRPNYCDYVFTRATLSIATGEIEELEYAEQLLQFIEFKEPYLRDQQQNLLISVLKCKVNGTNESIIKRALASLRGLFYSANKYILVQPNFMGIGVNINKVIEDSEKEHTKLLHM